MLAKYVSLLLPLVLLVQNVWMAPTGTAQTQEPLSLVGHNETINLMNALFRAQIVYFSGVREKLTPSTKRAQDIELYVTRLNEAIAEKELDEKNAKWLSICDQFSKSPLLLNKEEETGLSNEAYQALLTDKKLKDITKTFLSDVSLYVLKIAKLSGKVVENGIGHYLEQNNNNKV